MNVGFWGGKGGYSSYAAAALKVKARTSRPVLGKRASERDNVFFGAER